MGSVRVQKRDTTGRRMNGKTPIYVSTVADTVFTSWYHEQGGWVRRGAFTFFHAGHPYRAVAAEYLQKLVSKSTEKAEQLGPTGLAVRYDDVRLEINGLQHSHPKRTFAQLAALQERTQDVVFDGEVFLLLLPDFYVNRAAEFEVVSVVPELPFPVPNVGCSSR